MAIKSRLLSALAIAILPWLPCEAGDVSVSYARTGDAQAVGQWGTDKSETYDMAVYLSAPQLQGKKVTEISIPSPPSADLRDFKVWIASELPAAAGVFTPDILSVDATRQGNLISATLPEPYVLGDKGVYVGYSFTVNTLDALSKRPVAVCGKVVEGAFFVHTNRTYIKWKDRSAELGFSHPISVKLSGDISANAASAVAANDAVAQKDREMRLPVTIVNEGSSAIRSIDYTVTVDDAQQAFSGSADFSAYPGGIAPGLGTYLAQGIVELSAQAVGTVGRHSYTIAITAINGTHNPTVHSPSASGIVDVVAYLPENRPLLEEYTGVTCGYCPRGMAALERMSKLYPGYFIPVAYHCDDAMEIRENLPNRPSGLPSANLNRSLVCDPYMGKQTSGFGIEPLWNEYRAKEVPVGIEVATSWADEAKTILNVDASATFIKQMDVPVALTYILTADGLTNARWQQANYYAGTNDPSWIDEMKPYLEAEHSIKDIVYNHVVALAAPQMGIEGSLPETIVPYQSYSHRYQFDLSTATSVRDVNLVPDPDRIQVIALVVNTLTGQVLNCNTDENTYSAVSSPVATARTVVATDYHDLSGRRIDPSDLRAGLYIKTLHFSDGTRTATKILR